MRIALVDDCPNDLSIMHQFLAEALDTDSVITEFHNGEDFLQHWSADTFDLIVLDIYMDYASHRVTLHCKKDETITLRVPFQEIEQLLCHYSYFYSPCKGIIVNFYEVCGQSGTVFSMSDGSLIPISRRKSADVLCAYSSFCFDKIRKEMS